MEYPINIEQFIKASKALCSSSKAEMLLRSVLPLVNEAYEQGRRDAGRLE